MLQLSWHMPLVAQKQKNDSIPPFGGRECCSCLGTRPRQPKKQNDSIPPLEGGMLQFSRCMPTAAQTKNDSIPPLQGAMLQLSGCMPPAAKKNCKQSVLSGTERCSCPGTRPRRPKKNWQAFPPLEGAMLQLSGCTPPAAKKNSRALHPVGDRTLVASNTNIAL